MTSSQLPERPNLEQLKRQAKELLQAARDGNPAQLARFRHLPSLAAKTDPELTAASLALHDAQSVIAREHGFVSWNALRERVEELSLEFAGAVQEFIAAATDGRTGRAARLLELHPGIAGAGFHPALLLGEVAAVEADLARRPALATSPGGVREWSPLLYLCHASFRRTEAHAAAAAAIAQRLLQLGADPNERYPWLHHGVRRPALWAACCVARNLALARVLLEAGANPNDGITLPLAASGADLPALELLLAHGANVNFPWATDGATPLYAILNWASKAGGIQWLLEHGADPDPVFPANGETPLHVAARKGDPALVESLVQRGADITRRRADGRTAFAVAELNGNRAVADWLEAHGAPTDLSDADRFIALCSRGDRTAAEAMLANQPDLRGKLGAEHQRALVDAAERGDTAAVETLLACGFDPNRGDEIGKTALHAAAHEGWPEVVAVLLRYGAAVQVTDCEFRAPPLIWAADGARTRRDAGRDFAIVARLLIAAGSPTDWQPGQEPAADLMEIVADWRRG